MGLIPQAIEDARSKGVRLALKYIPKDVFDRRAVEKNQVVFYDVAYVEVQARAKGLEVTVSLTDFASPTGRRMSTFSRQRDERWRIEGDPSIKDR